MKSALTAVALLLISVSAFASQNSNYQFTLVVQTGQTIDGHELAALGNPGINNPGDIIFTGYEKAPIGSSTFLAGLFSTHRLLASYNGSLPACLGSYIVNDSGKIAFVQNTNLGTIDTRYASGIYETELSGGPVKTIVAPGQLVNGAPFIGNFCDADTSIASSIGFSFNDSGRILFGNYEYTPEKGLTTLSFTEVRGQKVGLFSPVAGTPEEVLEQSGIGGIFTPDRFLVRPGDSIDGLTLTQIFPLASSRRGLVFDANYGPAAAQQFALFTTKSVIAKTGQSFGDKTLAFPLTADVNDCDQVIFTGAFNNGSLPDFTAIADSEEIIVAVGDTINGHTITSLGDQPVLNDAGVVAFQATFSDGSQAIVKALRKWKK